MQDKANFDCESKKGHTLQGSVQACLMNGLILMTVWQSYYHVYSKSFLNWMLWIVIDGGRW